MESGSDGGHVFMALFPQYRELRGGVHTKPPLTFHNGPSGCQSLPRFSLGPKNSDFPHAGSDSCDSFGLTPVLLLHRERSEFNSTGNSKKMSETRIFQSSASSSSSDSSRLTSTAEEQTSSHTNSHFVFVVKRPFRPRRSGSG